MVNILEMHEEGKWSVRVGYYNFKWVRESLSEKVTFEQGFKEVE